MCSEQEAYNGIPFTGMVVNYNEGHHLHDCLKSLAFCEQLVVIGASAYAAIQMAQSIIGTVTVSGATPRHYQEWAERHMQVFERSLEQLRKRTVVSGDARTWPQR